MGFIEIWNSLSPQDKLFLLVWFLISTMPFLAAAIKLKKRVKVARIDMHAFVLYYSLTLITLFWLINIWWDPSAVFADLAGVFIGIVLMFIVFNKISEGVKKAFILQLTIEDINIDVNLCYIYEYAGYRCIIQLDNWGHEAFSALWDRLIHNKRTFLLSEGAHFEFKEHKVNVALFCTSWDWADIDLPINGKAQTCHTLTIVPIPATEYSLIDFLAKFKSFKKYVRKIADQNKENIELRANIYLLAGKLFKKWVLTTEKNLYGEDVQTLDDLIEEFNQEFENLPESSNIIPESKKEVKDKEGAKSEETEEEAESEEEEEGEGEESEEEEPEE